MVVIACRRKYRLWFFALQIFVVMPACGKHTAFTYCFYICRLTDSVFTSLPERTFVRHPREGRARVPEAMVSKSALIDNMILSSGDISVDISDTLVWGTDVMTKQKMSPRLPCDTVARHFSWTAHEDTIKTLELIREEFDGIDKRSRPSNAFETNVGETFITEVDGACCAGAQKKKFEVAALLTSSRDQRTCLWNLEGSALGQLRQGDRDCAQNWNFPVTPEMLQSRRDAESKRLMQVI